LPRSKVYFAPAEPSAEARHRMEQMMVRIDFWHTEMPFLGTRKMAVKLSDDGFCVGRKLVRRLMAEMGIHAPYPKANLSKRNFKQSIVPYLLKNKMVFPAKSGVVD
jgi:putative transposase